MGVKNRLREIMAENNMTIQSFSDFIEVPKGTLEKYLHSDRLPSSEVLLAIRSKMGVSADWLLGSDGPKHVIKALPFESSLSGDGDHEFIPIQRYDVSAAAGSGSLIGAELGTGFYAFNRKWLDRRGLQPQNLAVIAVRGDSMEPDLHDKDLILLDRSQTAPADGDIYVLRYSGMLFVKRVQVIPGNRAELRSTNPLYGPIIVTMETAGDDLAFIGRVVASMHEW